jgi:outer membrane protein assembly factor BamD
MQKIKNLMLLAFLSFLLFSCGEYQKVLNKGTVEDQYKMAVKMYEIKKYGKAIRLFEKITPAYRGKPQMERIQTIQLLDIILIVLPKIILQAQN